MKNYTPNKNCKFIDATNEILKSYKKGPRRTRIKLTCEQLMVLEERFLESHHPTHKLKEELVEKIKLPIKNIQIWFQNRRAKEKSEKVDRQIRYEKKQLKEIMNMREMGPHIENHYVPRELQSMYYNDQFANQHYFREERDFYREYEEYLIRSRK